VLRTGRLVDHIIVRLVRIVSCHAQRPGNGQRYQRKKE
jgi:hypothetical protein